MRVAIDRIDIDTDRRRVRVGAGVSSARLVETLVDEGIGGLEFAAGLPGTIGGAVAGNAGCFGSTVGERLVSADAISREGTALEVEGPGWFGFGYRRSRVAAEGAVLTDVVLAVEPGDRARLREESAARLADRAGRHPPPGTLTAGSYFRNLPPLEPGGRRRAAGLLLDRVGAKEMSEGDAAVFERHANIVVNRGRASARDVLALTRGMAARVEKRFGEVLVPEVRFVGSSPEGF